MIGKTSYKPIDLFGKVNDYVIYKPLTLAKGSTRNQFYYVFRQDNPRRELDLHVLKAYQQKQGYLIEKKVFQQSGLYTSFLLAQCDQFINNGIPVYYTVLKNIKNGSLIEFLSLVKNLPFQGARFFLKQILKTLNSVISSVNISHQTLYSSDILVDDNMKPIVVGWSKRTESVNEKELLYDCADIFHTMLFGRPILLRASSIKKAQRQRFVQKKDWDLLKKKVSGYKLPDEKIILQILQLCLFKDQKLSIEQILAHQFFKTQQNMSDILQTLDALEKKNSAEKKEKSIQKLNKKVSRMAAIQNQQSELASQDRDLLAEFCRQYIECIDQINNIKIQKVNSAQRQAQQAYQQCQPEPQAKQAQSIKKSRSQVTQHSIMKKKSSQNKQHQAIQQTCFNKTAFLLASLKALLSENKGKQFILQKNEGKLVQYYLLSNQNQASTIIDLQFQIQIYEIQQGQPGYLSIQSKITVDNKTNRVQIEIVKGNCHEYYQQMLYIFLKDQISIILA